MTFTPDPAYAAAAATVTPWQGEFLGRYESEHGQAWALIFRKGDFLRAYLSYKKGMKPEDIIDDYLADLGKIAEEQGLTLKILHTVD